MKTKKCIGCGAELQYLDENKEGYIEGELLEKAVICKRCFRLKNYNDYKATVRDNKDYTSILKNVGNTRDLVLYVVDIFNLNYDMDMIFEYLKNDIILVITKEDIIPKSVQEYKIIDYFKKNERFKDIVMISANRNYNLDKLFRKINEIKKSNNVYVVGKTNAGKSTLINKFIKNYSMVEHDITTSYLPSTTLDTIKIKLTKDLTLIDTPGLIDETDIINFIDAKEIKTITPRREIKPITYQIYGETSIIVDPYVRIDTDCTNSFTFYMSNELEVRKNSFKNDKLKELKKYQFVIEDNMDIVVNGLLWVKTTKACEFTIYAKEGVLVYTRKNII